MTTVLLAATSATSVGDVLAVIGACLVAGAVNALAGGGSLLSYPTMVAIGLGPVTANVSNTLALWPGYLSGAAALRGRVAEADARLPVYALAAGLGAVGGAVLLLAGDPDTFEAIVPFLVIMAALLLAVPQRWLERLRSHPRAGGTPAALAGVSVAGVYGAYFGGGLGVILLAVLNAFVGFAPVTWWVVAAGAPAALVGGLAGARLSDRVPIPVLRRTVVVLGLAAGIALLVT